MYYVCSTIFLILPGLSTAMDGGDAALDGSAGIAFGLQGWILLSNTCDPVSCGGFRLIVCCMAYREGL